MSQQFENLQAKQWPVFKVGFLSPLQLNNSSNNENTVKSSAFWLLVWKKWCLEKGIAKETKNYEPTQLNTLLERSNVEMKKQTWLNLGNNNSISSKVIRTQTEQFLELFSRTLTFLHLKEVKISLHIIVLIIRSCFDWKHGLNILFLYLMLTLCLCLLMISYLIFFHVYY